MQPLDQHVNKSYDYVFWCRMASVEVKHLVAVSDVYFTQYCKQTTKVLSNVQVLLSICNNLKHGILEAFLCTRIQLQSRSRSYSTK